MTVESYPDFVERIRSRLLAVALFYGSRPCDAEDAVQEVLTRMFERWLDLSARQAGRSAGYLDAYAQKSVRNTVFKDIRGRRGWTELDSEQLADRAPRVSVETWLTTVDIVGKFRLLPRRQREVAVCRILLDLSAEETAAILGLSGRLGIWKVNSSLGRARDRLARLLELDGEIPVDLENPLLGVAGQADLLVVALRRAYAVLREAFASGCRR